MPTWGQSAYFFMAEGNYPFPSTYITYSLLPGHPTPLPAWPMRVACDQGLNGDFGIRRQGNVSDVVKLSMHASVVNVCCIFLYLCSLTAHVMDSALELHSRNGRDQRVCGLGQCNRKWCQPDSRSDPVRCPFQARSTACCPSSLLDRARYCISLVERLACWTWQRQLQQPPVCGIT
eukprot:SAG31_NODE_10293_length_1159_cov_1.013208_2_plen_176_part_00